MMRGRGRQMGGGHGSERGRGRSQEEGPAFRMTTAREVVMNVVKKIEGYLTADEVYSQAKKIYPSLGLATVYRALELLTNSDMLNKKDFGDGYSKYEYTEGKKTTRICHVICESCGKVVDHDDLTMNEVDAMDSLIGRIKDQYNFEPLTDEIRVRGICSKCK
jgi:Fur family transcriptional regulator, ferric uptake regulator